jgi:hypothetical protein
LHSLSAAGHWPLEELAGQHRSTLLDKLHIQPFSSQCTNARQTQHSKSKNQIKHFIVIMLVRYLCLAILTATAPTTFSQSVPESADNNSNDMARQLAGDFDWDIQPEDGYPSIA